MPIHNIPSDRTAGPRIHHGQMITVSAPQTQAVTYCMDGRGFISQMCSSLLGEVPHYNATAHKGKCCMRYMLL